MESMTSLPNDRDVSATDTESLYLLWKSLANGFSGDGAKSSS